MSVGGYIGDTNALAQSTIYRRRREMGLGGSTQVSLKDARIRR
jgi:hypothetical protein